MNRRIITQSNPVQLSKKQECISLPILQRFRKRIAASWGKIKPPSNPKHIPDKLYRGVRGDPHLILPTKKTQFLHDARWIKVYLQSRTNTCIHISWFIVHTSTLQSQFWPLTQLQTSTAILTWNISKRYYLLAFSCKKNVFENAIVRPVSIEQDCNN